MAEGAAYMAELARDAGFFQRRDHSDRRPTRGIRHHRCRGAAHARHLFHVRCEEFDPAEWSSPPLEGGKMVDKPGFGLSIVGRGAVNQKGPEATFLAALPRDPRCQGEIARQHRPDLRGRGGDRLAAFPPSRPN